MSLKIKRLFYLLFVSFTIAFFFLHGGLWLLNSYSANWAYVFDQLGLAGVGVVVSFFWLKKKHVFRLSWWIILLISFFVIITHYNSFYRAVFDEWNNVIQGILALHDGKLAPGGFFVTRERYAWSPFTILLEVVKFGSPHFNFIMSSFGILMTIGASLAVAWLGGIISQKKTVALLAGLLVGISPNTFASLPWPSSVQGDALGIILVALTVSVWIIARKSGDSKGILLALLFLAASLKGGGSVRTITSGSLLVMTDLILFSKDFKKRWLIDWLGILLIGVFFYLSNDSIHLSVRSQHVSLVVRVAQIMELTTKSFIPPTFLAWVMGYLLSFKMKIIWVVAIGVAVFTLGSILSLLCLRSKSLKIFSWGWLWFYLTVFYAPWFAEGYGSTLDSINDRMVFNLLDMGGYKYAYLPLVGAHIAVAIFLGMLAKNYKKLFVVIAIAIIGLRGYEFLKLDYKWRIEVATPNREWQGALFSLLPPGSGDPKFPSILVLTDGKHNPLHSSFYSVEHGVYYDGSVKILRSIEELKEYKSGSSIQIEKIFAMGWDSGRQEMVNLTQTFRNWLKNPNSAAWNTSDFTNWRSNIPKKDGFFVSEIVKFGDLSKLKEPEIASSELNVFIPNPDGLNFKLVFYAEKDGKPFQGNALFIVGVVCNSDHGKTKRGDLVGNQETFEDQLGNSKVKIITLVKSGKATLEGKLSCSGAILKRIVIIGPTDIGFKLLNLEISFPYERGVALF